MIENEWLCVMYMYVCVCVCDTKGMLDVLFYMDWRHLILVMCAPISI